MPDSVSYLTPGTRVQWSNVAEWCVAAGTLNRRRLSRKMHRDLETHAMCLPLAMIKPETDLEAIEEAVWLYKRGPIGIRRETDVMGAGGNWLAAHGEQCA